MKQSLFNREPALLTASVVALLALLAGAGVTWITDERSSLIVAFVTAVLALVGGSSVRQTVYSPATVEKLELDAGAALDDYDH